MQLWATFSQEKEKLVGEEIPKENWSVAFFCLISNMYDLTAT